MLAVQVGAVDLTAGAAHHLREVHAVRVRVEHQGDGVGLQVGVGLSVGDGDDGVAVRLHGHAIQQPARREQQEVGPRVVCAESRAQPHFKQAFLVFFKYTLLSPSGNSGRLTRVRLQQPQEQPYPVIDMHAGSRFRVSVIHRTLTWTTESLTCVRDHSYACVYTRGLGTPTASQHNIFDSGKTLTNFSCAADARGIRTPWSFDLDSDAIPSPDTSCFMPSQPPN